MKDKKIESLKRKKEIQAEIKAHKKLKLKLQKENLKRKKELALLESELPVLISEYDEKQKYNDKQNKKRNIHYAGAISKKILPYALAVGSMYICFSSSNATPIFKDEVKATIKYMKEFDSNGRYVISEQVNNFKNDKSIITYNGKWLYNEETKEYEREIRNYKVGFLNKYLVDDIVEKNEQESLDKLFGEPISTYKQRTSTLTDEELSSESYISAMIFGKDKNQIVFVDESTSRNTVTTILYIIVCSFFGIILDKKIFENADFNEIKNNIAQKYPNLDLTELENVISQKEERCNVLKKKRVM